MFQFQGKQLISLRRASTTSVAQPIEIRLPSGIVISVGGAVEGRGAAPGIDGTGGTR